jgi:hypothetical protein
MENVMIFNQLCRYKSNNFCPCLTSINIRIGLKFGISLQCHHYLRKDRLPVYQRHVDQMQSAENRMEQVLVPVFLIMWEIHMKVVVQNVC